MDVKAIRFINARIKETTIKEILESDEYIFISHIGTLIDFYAALHPDKWQASPDLAQHIAGCVKRVNEIRQTTPEQARTFMEDLP